MQENGNQQIQYGPGNDLYFSKDIGLKHLYVQDIE